MNDQQKVIYTVTCVSGEPHTREDRYRMRSRNWGFFFNRADAEQSIRTNETDMSELGYYQYAVLQSQHEGVCIIPDELQWFEFIWPPRIDGKAQWEIGPTVVAIDRPLVYEGIFFG